MTIKEFADNYGEVTQMVLCEAGIRCIRSYRSIYHQTPPKKPEGLYEVYDYPDSFLERMKIIFKRLVKERLIVEVAKPIKRRRMPKKLYSSNG